jgi:hypothetical protein
MPLAAQRRKPNGHCLQSSSCSLEQAMLIMQKAKNNQKNRKNELYC